MNLKFTAKPSLSGLWEVEQASRRLHGGFEKEPILSNLSEAQAKEKAAELNQAIAAEDIQAFRQALKG